MRNVLVVLLFALLPVAVFADDASRTAAAATSDERAQFWREALEHFRAERPEGTSQIWLAAVTPGPAIPFCNCYSDACCPPGSRCNKIAGCMTWDGEDGYRRDGLCTVPPPADPQETPLGASGPI